MKTFIVMKGNFYKLIFHRKLLQKVTFEKETFQKMLEGVYKLVVKETFCVKRDTVWKLILSSYVIS